MRTVKEIMRDSTILNSEGIHIGGSDRESNHRYGDAYERIIFQNFCNSGDGPARCNVNLMMEIGVADGSSLLAWSEVFPNALCVGMDIHHSDKAHGDRIEFRFGDQRVKRDCEEAAAGRLFDVIVEDATHQIENTLLTLYWMWPFVKRGGLYVVEEWDGVDRNRILGLWPNAEIVDTNGPFGGIESLVVFRKPL